MSKKRRRKLGKHRQVAYWATDYHHILYQRKHWQNGYAKLLREHPYMGKYIPTATLHSEIHSKIHDIPTPNSKDCKRAYHELLNREAGGLIDIQNDTIEQRIDFLIEMWQKNCPATVAILKWQRDIVRKYYERRA